MWQFDCSHVEIFYEIELFSACGNKRGTINKTNQDPCNVPIRSHLHCLGSKGRLIRSRRTTWIAPHLSGRASISLLIFHRWRPLVFCHESPIQANLFQNSFQAEIHARKHPNQKIWLIEEKITVCADSSNCMAV